jgi:hypothetical protein
MNPYSMNPYPNTYIIGSSKESVGKTRMSFSLFNQDTDLRKSPSPFPPGEGILFPISFWLCRIGQRVEMPGEGVLFPIAFWSYAALT